MKVYSLITALLISHLIAAEEAPKIFNGLFKKDIPIKGQIGMVMPPPEIDKYFAKIDAAVYKDEKSAKWFDEFCSGLKPGIPLPYDERIGLTKEEHADYIKLWNSREFKPQEDVMLLLRESSGDTWTITATGGASPISTLRFSPKNGVFQSPNGKLSRLVDINAGTSSILGKWSGMEWKFEEETSLGKTKENFALGKFADEQHGIIVYRLQELSIAGTRLLDRSIVVRFPLSQPATKKD